ncbi:Transcription factor himD [Paramyrothecium foliicola]|nr:Transcription factor himD [Paramyrothecium foliicola]
MQIYLPIYKSPNWPEWREPAQLAPKPKPGVFLGRPMGSGARGQKLLSVASKPSYHRCHRLNKECSSRPPAPPRVKKRVKRSRVAELEKRLDELSSQFDQPPPLAGTSETSTSTPPPAPAAHPNCAHKPLDKSVLGGPLVHIFTPPASSAAEAGTEKASGWECLASRAWHSLWPLPGEAEELMAFFDRGMAGLFPFVVIPKGVSEAELRTRRPFLWKAVMMSSSVWDGPRQVELGHKLLADISHSAIMEGQQSLDLLQGLMLLIAWFHYALKSTQLTNLLFLARSMCVNLGVKGGSMPTQVDSDTMVQNLHHLRAFAGTYYLNTLVFTTNKRTDVFMDSSHLETCCQTLETMKQYPSDDFLVKLVRIQQLAQAISSTMAFESGQPPTRLPLLMVVESFQTQLDAFRESLPAHLRDNKPLSTHIYIAEVLLLDFAISDRHCNSTIMPLTDRLRLLWSCVRSLRAFLMDRFAVHDTESMRFLCLSSSDLAYVIITGMKLLTLRLPGWNLEHIATELRLSHLVQQLEVELERDIARRHKTGMSPAPSALGIEEPWERTLRLLKNVREMIRTQLEASNADAASYGDAAQGLLTGVSEAFWQDVLDESMWKVEGDAAPFDLG